MRKQYVAFEETVSSETLITYLKSLKDQTKTF